MLLRFIRFPGILVAVALIFGAALAQDARQIQLNGWNATLNQIDATLQRADLDAATLAELKGEVEAVLAGADALKRQLQPQIADAEAQQQSLGPPPAPPATEPAVVVAQRERLRAILTSLTGIVEQADVLAVRASQLLATIDDRLSQQFTSALFAHGPSILSALLWARVAMEVPGVVERGAGLIGEWFELIAGRSDGPTALLIIASLLVVAVILACRSLFLRWTIRREVARTAPSEAARILAATSVVILAVAVPFLILAGLRAVFDAHGILPERIAILYDGLTQAVLVFAVLTGLARAVFAPARPAWRIARLSDRTALGLFRLIVIAAVLLALLPLIGALADVTVASADFTAALGGGIALAVAIIVLAGGSRIARDGAPAQGETAEPAWRWRWLAPIASAAAVAAIVADIAGYLALARFLVEQIAWVSTVLGLLVLALGLVRQAVTTLFSSERAVGSAVTRNVGLSPSASSQASVLVDGIARLLLFVLAVVLIAAPWGFDSSDLVGELGQALNGVQIGTITITFSTILAAIAVFVAGVIIARMFQTWLDRRFLPTTPMDAGLRDSITTSLGYLGIILAALAAASFAGFSLANIAIVAGALSVGIGFGLQSIVNNFVSGLILLAERPIRTGDWIVVGPDEGLVKRIRVRATEIETFDRASVIIPNSSLISGVVKNLYFRDSTARIIVAVGVGYDSDPEQVQSILLDCAKQNRAILAHPAPQVLFMDFGASSLDFELRCFVAEALLGTNVKSDLRFAILERLRQAGIEIPYPQSDLTLRDWPRIERAIRGMTGDAAESEGTKQPS